MMRRDGGHRKETISAAPPLLSDAHAPLEVSSASLCLPQWEWEAPKRLKQDVKGKERVKKERDEQSWEICWMVSERLSLTAGKLSVNKQWEGRVYKYLPRWRAEI